MASQDFLLMDKLFTILLGLLPLVNTLWYMLVVLPKLIQLLLWTKFAFSTVESQQVSKRSIATTLCNIIMHFIFLLDQIEFCRSWCCLECCKTEKGVYNSNFWIGGYWSSCESLPFCTTLSILGLKLFWCTSFWSSLLLVLIRRPLLLFYMIRLLKGLESLVL